MALGAETSMTAVSGARQESGSDTGYDAAGASLQSEASILSQSKSGQLLDELLSSMLSAMRPLMLGTRTLNTKTDNVCLAVS